MAAIDRQACVYTSLCESGSGIASIAYVLSRRQVCMILVSFIGEGVPIFNLNFLIVVTYIFVVKIFDTFHFLSVISLYLTSNVDFNQCLF